MSYLYCPTPGCGEYLGSLGGDSCRHCGWVAGRVEEEDTPDDERNAACLTHTEKAAAVRVARPCSAHDVLAGGQCGNCLWKAAT